MTRTWRPAVYDHEASRETATRTIQGRPVDYQRERTIPHIGELIALTDRRAYRVVAVHDREQANWHQATTQAWEQAGQPDPQTWPGRERAMHVQAAGDPAGKVRARPLYPWYFGRHWWPLPDPYPACVGCGLLWPCPCQDRNVEARRAMAEFDRLAAVLPGCCWNCGQPIDRRQQSITFDGDNLLLPGGGPVVFHTAGSRYYQTRTGRRGCRQAAVEYERRWVDAAPGRRARLSCPGILWRHFGYSECTTGGDCAGVQADHKELVHCTVVYGTWTRESGTAAVAPLSWCGERGCRGPKGVPGGVEPATAESGDTR